MWKAKFFIPVVGQITKLPVVEWKTKFFAAVVGQVTKLPGYCVVQN